MINKKRYILPLTGSVLNWGTLSGSIENPIRYVGPKEFLQSFVWPEEIPINERYVTTSLIEIDINTCGAIVDVEANDVFLSAFDSTIANKTLEQIAGEFGVVLLKRQQG